MKITIWGTGDIVQKYLKGGKFDDLEIIKVPISDGWNTGNL